MNIVTEIANMRNVLEGLQKRIGIRQAEGITGDDPVMARMIGRREELERAMSVIERLRGEVEKLTRRNGLIIEEAERDGQHNRQLRIERFRQFGNEDCWIYGGDDHDNLETLVCPVVMSPQHLIEILQERDQLKTEIAHLQIEVNNLRGLKPEIPPMPGEDWPKELPRYILRWNGHNQPTSVPHKDGYWTPWYLANRLYEELERERKAARTACTNWGKMKRERDQLKDRLNEKYSPPPGVIGYMQKDQLSAFIDSGSQHDLVGLDSPDCWAEEAPYQNLVAVCAIESIAQHDAQVIKQFVRDYTDWQGIDWMLTDFMHKRVDELSQQAKEQ
jgi:hypothetical protein